MLVSGVQYAVSILISLYICVTVKKIDDNFL